MLVAINRSFGGFRLSTQAQKKIAKKKGIEVYCYGIRILNGDTFLNPQNEDLYYIYFTNKYLGENPCAEEILEETSLIDLEFSKSEERTDKELIEAINELGVQVNTRVSNIKLVEVPDGIHYEIWNRDGLEVIVEIGHYWR